MTLRPGQHLPTESEQEEVARAVSSWRTAIRLAMEQRDPSVLALHLTRGRVPASLQDEVYRLVVLAPWRDAPPAGGRARKLNEVDRYGVIALYMGTAIAGNDRRRLTHAQIVDDLCHRYGVSKSTIERVLRSHGGLMPKPPRVLKPKTRR